MRTISTVVLALAAVSLAACERSNPAQPERTLSPSALHSSGKGGGKPEIDPVYANDRTFYMIGPHLIMDARSTMPNFYDHAEELYLVVYPQDSHGVPILPATYQPQCNPCYHPGLPPAFVFHDHVLSGAPGMGNNGTAGQNMGPWKMILVMYTSEYVRSPGFTPLKSQAEIDAAEQAGNILAPMNPGPGNPYEFETGNVLICPTVSDHA